MSIVDVKNRHKEEIMSKPGVIGIGIGRNVIVVYVDKDMPIPTLPSELEGYLVKVYETGAIKLL